MSEVACSVTYPLGKTVSQVFLPQFSVESRSWNDESRCSREMENAPYRLQAALRFLVVVSAPFQYFRATRLTGLTT